jgi:predicted ATPase
MPHALIGRERDVEALVSRLAERRLVTVIGPGGIGKTVLARAAVPGAPLVDLTLVADDDAVPGTFAGQLGVASFEAAVGMLADAAGVLLVDNCEHVADGVASLVTRILDATDALTVLATSRSPLDLPGESVLVLAPLELPAPAVADPEAAAVRLFVERARDAGGDVGDDDEEVVAELCRRLDGVPLALEIAAARTRSMTCAEILGRLADQLDLLSRPRFRGAGRHRSVREATAWSHRLLDVDLRLLFDRLGVFAGPFTAAMAHGVAAEPGATAPGTADRLDALVDASLVVVDRGGTVTRYRQLEALRAFALDQLVTRGEVDAIRDRFVDHVAACATRIIADSRGRWDGTVLGELLALFDNISSALRWCLARDDEPERALLLCAVLWGVVHQARTDDVALLGEDVLARWPEPCHALWADAAATVATCRYLTGRRREAIELAERALASADGSVTAPITLRRVLGQARRSLGESEAPAQLFAAAAELGRAGGATALAMEMDVAHALVLADTGRVDKALGIVRAVQAEAVVAGADVNEVWSRVAEGSILLRVDPEAALRVLSSGLDAARRIGYSAGVCAGLRSAALAHVAGGRLPAAARTVRDLLDDQLARGALSELRMVLDTAAIVVERAGRPAWADLAATANTFPIVSLTSSVGRDLWPLPDEPGRVLTAREAVLTARRELAAVASDEGRVEAPAVSADAEAVFRRNGDFWDVSFAGRTVHLKGSKGLADLGQLLATPDVEHHCLDLMGAAVEERSTGEVIDDTARRRYEARVRELQGELDEAEANNDTARVEKASIELDQLIDHLTSVMGLGGRGRRAASSAERARSAVTQRVRSTIRRIAVAHPELGRHLTASITTGTYCSYRPERPVPWRVER